MIKIYANIPGLKDGTCWYRGAGPMKALQRDYRDTFDITIVDGSAEVDWHDVADVDIAFLQRPHHMRCRGFFNLSSLFTKKIVCDWDDDLNGLHPSNPSFESYDDPNTKKLISEFMKECTSAWTTTIAMKESIDRRAGKDKAVVIPNAWADQWFKMGEPGNNNTVIWRGGSSHTMDKLEFAPEIEKVAARSPLWKWVMIGDRCWEFRGRIPPDRMANGQWLPTPLFLANYVNCQPGIVMVPLQDNAFNRAKSNISWMEGVAAGAIVVCPDWPEWRVPGTMRYQSVNDFAEVLTDAMNLPITKRKEMAMEGQEHVKQHYLLSDINRLRADALLQLAGTREAKHE